MESIEHELARTGSDKAITFVSGVASCCLTSSVLTALPLAVTDTSVGHAIGELAFVHALPLSMFLVWMMMSFPNLRGSKSSSATAGAFGAATTCLVVLVYVAAGALSTVLSDPQDMLLLLAPVVGGYFGGMAAARVMPEALLPALAWNEAFDTEDDRVIVNPQSWADRTEGWTRDPRH